MTNDTLFFLILLIFCLFFLASLLRMEKEAAIKDKAKKDSVLKKRFEVLKRKFSDE